VFTLGKKGGVSAPKARSQQTGRERGGNLRRKTPLDPKKVNSLIQMTLGKGIRWGAFRLERGEGSRGGGQKKKGGGSQHGPCKKGEGDAYGVGESEAEYEKKEKEKKTKGRGRSFGVTRGRK